MIKLRWPFSRSRSVSNPDKPPTLTTEQGSRSTEDAKLRALYETMLPNMGLRSAILDVRRMDMMDGQVKRIHHRTSHALTKGLLTLDNPKKNKRLSEQWRLYSHALGLHQREKLASDARGLVMEGNLPLQWVLNAERNAVVKAIRMPSETIRVNVGENGQISDVANAYYQYDYLSGKDIASFAYWQLDIARLDPLNFDDDGELGRPFLDANRKIWRQMQMTLEDLVVRRRHRAPMRTAHVLEGANDKDLRAYKAEVENDEEVITSNYYLNKPGGVTAVQGDANLDQIADISLLLDAFYSGTPAPKGLFGYADGLSRDILEDMKAEFYDELDILQDLQSAVYAKGFYLHLLLQGINPDSLDYEIRFAERSTETLNQRTDRALKQRALGASRYTALTTAGLDPEAEEDLLADEKEINDPYPMNVNPPKVSVTPNNARKNESATSISNA